jgi:Cof subfamily protein (haloacid dehalogenase superfamily)
LVVTDIDGTLITSDQRVTPGVREAVRRARTAGARVCVATGRIWRSARRYVEAVDPDSPVILYNGGLIFDFVTGETLHRAPLPRARAIEALTLLRDEPHVAPHLYVGDEVFVREENELTEFYRRRDRVTLRAVGDLPAFLAGGGGDREAMKILIVGETARLQALQRRLQAQRLPVHSVFSEPFYLELLPDGCSKGIALEILARRFAVARSEIMAVGDNLNDLEMIQYAGVGVAMANAVEPLRAAADWVTASNEEDGLRIAIERWVLREERTRETGTESHEEA